MAPCGERTNSREGRVEKEVQGGRGGGKKKGRHRRLSKKECARYFNFLARKREEGKRGEGSEKAPQRGKRDLTIGKLKKSSLNGRTGVHPSEGVSSAISYNWKGGGGERWEKGSRKGGGVRPSLTGKVTTPGDLTRGMKRNYAREKMQVSVFTTFT